MGVVTALSRPCHIGQCHNCRAAEWGCSHACHESVLDGAIPASSSLRESGGEGVGFGPAGTVDHPQLSTSGNEREGHEASPSADRLPVAARRPAHQPTRINYAALDAVNDQLAVVVDRLRRVFA